MLCIQHLLQLLLCYNGVTCVHMSINPLLKCCAAHPALP